MRVSQTDDDQKLLDEDEEFKLAESLAESFALTQ